MGALIMPVGDTGEQQLIRVIGKGDEDFELQSLEAVRFVPLIGAHGWQGE